MATSKVIFNQYYYDLLTKIRTIAKKHKDNSSTANKVLEVMKDNYKEFDKTSGEYVDFLNTNCNDDFWKSYLDIEKENCDDWLKKDDIKNVCIFKDISIGEIAKLLRDNFLCHHFLSVFYIYKNEMSDESASNILKILQTFSDDFELDNENYKKVINRLNTMKSDKVKENSSFEGMGELKDTTIGKIAKEIIDDVNIDKFKQTMSEEGDILKALANPENGLGELFSKVGNKVSDKISSGELNQDAIMKDAMKFASMLPSMFGNNGGGGGGNGDFNMADMMRMMGAMNGGGGGGGRKTKTAVNKNGLKALAKKAELQKKLASKR
jgi:ribosomal protein S17E